MNKPIASRWQRLTLLWSGLGLGLTGLGQMPIFSRYYVADVPGLGWLGNFRITAAVHLALAVVFLAVLGFTAATWIGRGHARPRLSAVGWLLAAVAVTGLARVIQNTVSPVFPPGAIRYLDWSHLGVSVLLGLAALMAWIGRKKSPAGAA